jgi:hypothetical protein
VKLSWSKSAALFLLAGTAAAAADMLPLKHGIYVDANVACKGASNADTMSYWGKDNGLNVSRIGCRIVRLSKNGSTYTLQRTCRGITGSGTFKDKVAVKMISASSFALIGDRSVTYRYCGRKVQF